MCRIYLCIILILSQRQGIFKLIYFCGLMDYVCYLLKSWKSCSKLYHILYTLLLYIVYTYNRVSLSLFVGAVVSFYSYEDDNATLTMSIYFESNQPLYHHHIANLLQNLVIFFFVFLWIKINWDFRVYLTILLFSSTTAHH